MIIMLKIISSSSTPNKDTPFSPLERLLKHDYSNKIYVLLTFLIWILEEKPTFGYTLSDIRLPELPAYYLELQKRTNLPEWDKAIETLTPSSRIRIARTEKRISLINTMIDTAQNNEELIPLIPTLFNEAHQLLVDLRIPPEKQAFKQLRSLIERK